MKKGAARLLQAGLLLLILACCTNTPQVQEIPKINDQVLLGVFMNSSPSEGNLVFLGVAGIRSRRQESIDMALEDAARRIAIFHEVQGTISIISNLGGRFLDYRAESTASLSYDPNYKNYLDSLEFDKDYDVFESENAIFVRVRYPGSIGLNYYSASGPDGKPSWVDSPPAMIGGYVAGVGYAGRRYAHKDTVTASYENAIFAIIRNLYAVSSGEIIDYRGEGFLDYSTTTQFREDAQGRLNKFYVLDTWTDPVNKSVWTLGIAESN